jgi:RHS repeat-associated protein
VASISNGVDPATTYTYNSHSEVATVTAPYGTGSATTETDYTYESDGVTLHSVTAHRYDDSTSPRTLIDSPTVTFNHTTSYEHPEDVTTMVDAGSNTWTYGHAGYDDYGNLLSATDPKGNTRTTTYDVDSRPSTSVSGRGNASGATAAHFRSAVIYDAGGLPVTTLSSGSDAVVDNFDRPNATLSTADTGDTWGATTGTFATDTGEVKLSSASGTANMAVFTSSADQVISLTAGSVSQSGLGIVFRQSDATHYWKLVERPSSNYWELTYRSGSVTSSYNTGSGTCCTTGQRVMVRAVGSVIGVYIDGVLKLTNSGGAFSSSTGAGLFAEATGSGRIDQFSLGKAAAGITATTYNPDGAAIQTIDVNGYVTAMTLDAEDRATTVTRADATTLHYEFDRNGLQTKYTDGANNDTTYTYDHQLRPKTATRPGMSATTWSYAYTYYGETDTETQPSGATIATTTDAAGRSGTTSYSTGSPADITYTYDHAGHIATMSTTGATTCGGVYTSCWTFDSIGNLLSSTRAGRTISYDYDTAGNQTSIVYGTSKTITKDYDADGLLKDIWDWGNGSTPTQFAYDENSNLHTSTFPNGVVTTRTYDNTDRPTVISIDKASGPIQSFTQTYNALSQVSQVVSAGQIAFTKTYGYDLLNKLHIGASNAFNLDAADNPIYTVDSSNVQVNQGFNSSNQICWATATGTTATGCGTTPTGSTTFAYNASGDRTTKTPSTGTATTYRYDQANRLCWVYTGTSTNSCTSPPTGATASYTYDADGLRTSKTTSSGTTNFTWDDSAGLPRLLIDGTDNYIYGPLDEPIERISSTGAPTFIHQDHLGSTRILTDNTGSVSGTYTYKATGAVPSHTGTAAVNLQYAGQYTDTESGFQYLRARYYDPGTDQFLTLDPAVRVTGEAYAYAKDDPINAWDPSGLGCGLNPVCHVVNTVENDVIDSVARNTRLPDYLSIDVGYILRGVMPIAGNGLVLGGIDGNLTLTRDGHLYLGGGPATGTPPGLFASGRFGWLNRHNPTNEMKDAYASGANLTGSGTTTLGDLPFGPSVAEGYGFPGTATELGFGGPTPGASASYTYSWCLGKLW